MPRHVGQRRNKSRMLLSLRSFVYHIFSSHVKNSLCSRVTSTFCSCCPLLASTRTSQDTSSKKVQRWFPRLSKFNFTVEHTPDEQNIRGDILTRWVASANSSFPSRRLGALQARVITCEGEILDTTSVPVIAEIQAQNPPSEESKRSMDTTQIIIR